MLPAQLLMITAHEAGVLAAPRYLTARDEVWVRAVLDRFDAYVGRTVAERERDLPALVRAIARQHGVRIRAADGLTHVLSRRFKAKVDSSVDPKVVRRVVFEEAGRDVVFDRRGALERAAKQVGIPAQDVERGLFADRPLAKRIGPLAASLSATEATELYNLSLVQGLLLRTEVVTVEVREHTRAVVRFAKLTGLLCTCSLSETGTRLEVSGPLSVLRHTTKYGFALATFFPAVVSTTGFRMRARCVLRDEPVLVQIESTDRLARTHKLPRDADSAVERALARDFGRLQTSWTLVREANAVPIGTRVFFPDFTLRHESGFSVLVEVVGFYTPEYLRSKIVALRAAAHHALVVCIDETLACADGELPGIVVKFRRRVDARALHAAAERLLGEGARA